MGVYGLGPHLYSQNDPNSLIIGHDGSGNNAINTAARIDLKSKNGIIVLETGNHDMASSIGYVMIIALSIFIIRKKICY